MGNDMSVFEEGELEKDFWKAHGPKNESVTEFLSRSFAGLTKILMQPNRMEYCSADAESNSEDTDFRLELFTIPAPPPPPAGGGIRGGKSDRDSGSSEGNGGGWSWGRSRSRSSSSDSATGATAVGEGGGSAAAADLAVALWTQSQHRPGGVARPLVLYLHTNTRSLVDAKELLPLCDQLGASLLAFDLPGCGHSGGHLTFQMMQDLHRVVQHARQELGFQEVVLWARGMATALAVEYAVEHCAAASASAPPSCVKFVVLDSPFTSVKQMVLDGSKAVKCVGLAIPETLVRLACRVVRGKVSARLGSDPFDLKPLRLVERAVAEQQKQQRQQQKNQKKKQKQQKLPPCHILCALQDDYIPASHGRELQRAWTQGEGGTGAGAGGAQCGLEEFSGRHFGEREAGLLLGGGLARDIERALVFDKRAEEAAALAALNINMNSSSSSNSSSSGGNAFLLLGANMNNKVPWAGVW